MRLRSLLAPLILVALCCYAFLTPSTPECANGPRATARVVALCLKPDLCPFLHRTERRSTHSVPQGDTPVATPMGTVDEPAGSHQHASWSLATSQAAPQYRLAEAPPLPQAQLPAPPPPSGLARSACHEFDTHVDMDLLHGDLSSTPVAMGNSVEECCRMCDRTAGCKGLTLTPSGDCWLKSSISAPTKQRGLISASRRDAKSARAAYAAGALADAASANLVSEGVGATKWESTALTPFASSSALLPAAAPSASFNCSQDTAIGCMARPALVVMTHARADSEQRRSRTLAAGRDARRVGERECGVEGARQLASFSPRPWQKTRGLRMRASCARQ